MRLFAWLLDTNTQLAEIVAKNLIGSQLDKGNRQVLLTGMGYMKTEDVVVYAYVYVCVSDSKRGDKKWPCLYKDDTSLAIPTILIPLVNYGSIAAVFMEWTDLYLFILQTLSLSLLVYEDQRTQH